MRKIVKAILGACLCAVAVPSFAQTAGSSADAYAIMKAAEDKAAPKTTHALVKLELVDEKGGLSERVIEQWSAEDAAGLARSVIVFHTPATVKNSRFLTVENAGRDDDKWIFLPALKKVRRIAASEGGSSFMGTEFTYDDMATRKLDDYSYRLLGSEAVGGRDCDIVEALPKDPKKSQYAKIVTWMAKDPEIRLPLRAQMYKDASTVGKTLTMEEIAQVDGYWMPLRLTMKNEETGRATRLVQQKMELDKAVDERRFTVKFLETGRVE